MGISAAMEAGKSGLNIYRVATEVTSENIANVNTPGYSRQRVILESAPPTTANGFSLGTGVRIATVERYYDALLQQQLVNAQTTQGFDTTKSTVLQQIEPTFNEVSNDGLGDAVTKFFSSWQDLSLNPTGTSERSVVLTRAQVLVDNFHSTSQVLTDAITNQNSALEPLTSDINATLQSIAKLNGQIKLTEIVNGNANEIRDQRDQLIRDLSTQIGITFKENSDGTTDVKMGANDLVTGTNAAAFSLDKTNPNSFLVQLTPPGGGTPAAVPVTTGKLGATLALRDTIIPGYLAKVNDLATTIATQVNNKQMSGYDLNGVTNTNLIFSVTGSASAITVNPNLKNSMIAASGSATLKGDNSNAVLIANLQSTKTMSGGTATFNSYYNTLVSQVGLDVETVKNTVSQDEAFTKQLSALRESNSGVSLDEELTNLVKYQRSYQASAKLITTASDMMDIAINMIR